MRALKYIGITIGISAILFALDLGFAKSYVQSGMCKVQTSIYGAHAGATVECHAGRDIFVDETQLKDFVTRPAPGDTVVCTWKQTRGRISKNRYWIQKDSYQCHPFKAKP